MIKTFLSLGLAAALLAALPAGRAEAQIFRVWVSGSGGGSTCSRAAPCASFEVAHGVVSAGGEITCVDAGDYGRVIITKAVTIDCTGMNAKATSNACAVVGDGSCNTITIVAGPNDTVKLRGLSFHIGGASDAAIRFVSGAALHVGNVFIEGYRVGAAGLGGIGIFFTPGNGTTAKLHVEDTTITNSGLPGAGGGIVVQPSGSGSARVVIERTRLENNTYGIFANGANSTGVISVQVRDSLVSNNAQSGISSFTSSGHAITSIVVDHSSSLLNGASGILSQGGNAFVFLTESTVMSNVTGLNPVSGGAIYSYQNNRLTGNVTDGAPTGLLIVK
jgi:hypothetical protein